MSLLVDAWYFLAHYGTLTGILMYVSYKLGKDFGRSEAAAQARKGWR
jgi:hypothetical protein